MLYMTKEEKELKAGKVGDVFIPDDSEEENDADDSSRTKDETKTPVGKQGKQVSHIPVDREQLAQILRDNEEFRMKIDQLQSNAVSTQQGGPMIARNKKKETFIKLRRWNDQIVVGWLNKSTRPGRFLFVYRETDKDGDTSEYIDILLKDTEKPIKLNYLEYLQESEPVFVKMLKRIEEEEEVINQGRVYKKDFVENGYGMFETTVLVPVEVVIPHYSFLLQLEDGSELTISDRFVG